MKTFYKAGSALLLVLVFTASQRVLAQDSQSTKSQEPVKPTFGTPAPVFEQVTVLVMDLDKKKFPEFKRNTSTIPGVKVLGFCEGERILMMEVNETEYVKSVPVAEGKSDPSSTELPAKMPYDAFINSLVNDINQKNPTMLTTSSIKPVSEIQAKCATGILK